MTRRFPPPWTVHHGEGSYWVQSANGNRFAFCYFGQVQLTGTGMDHHLTEDEARRLTANIAKLPDLLKPSGRTVLGSV